MNRIKNIVVMVTAIVIMAGCASNLTTVRKLPQEAPIKSRYLFDAACECIGQRVNKYLEENEIRMVLFTDRFVDGTKNPLLPLPSELSSGGHNVMQHLTNQYISGNNVVQPLTTPDHVALYFRHGQLAEPSYYDTLMNMHSSNAIMAFDGEFTSLDQTSGSDGTGSVAKYKGENGDASLKLGNNSRGGLMSFVLKVGNPKQNQVIKTVGLQATFSKNDRSRSVVVAYKDVGAGYSRTHVQVDGLHNVQDNVIAAAWFYAWAAILPGDNELACLGSEHTSPSKVTEWMRSWEKWSKSKQISALQIELNHYAAQNDQELLPVSGKLSDDTWTRIRNVELELKMSPNSEGTLDALYVALLQSRAESEMTSNSTIGHQGSRDGDRNG